MCFSGGDQTEVLAAQLDRQLNLYNGLENTYTGMFTIEGGEGAVKGLQMTQSGNIISAVESGDIRIWEPSGAMLSDAMNAGKNLLTLRKHPTAEVVATGGHENPMKLWDLETEKTSFTAKNVRPDHLELRVPVWVTNVRFIGDGQCVVTTTGKHQIRLYDPRAQRRPVKELEWLEEPINALSTCHRPEHVLAGNTRGELGIFDLRGKISLASKYRGFAGAIRSIDAHPSAPYAASCGADRFVLVHNLSEPSHKPMKKIYCKVQLNSILMRNDNSLVSPTKVEAKDEIEDGLDQRPKPRNKLGSAGSDDSSEDEALWNDMKIVGQTKNQRKRAEVKEEPADDSEPLRKHTKLETRNKRKDSISEVDDIEVVPVKKHKTDRPAVKKRATNATRSKRRSESTLSEDSGPEETRDDKDMKQRKKSRKI
ncbi:NOP seven associated protein 1 [Aphelenchoides avenae]|nr:NOP seven associated protein 1 [Aphelenchus avenae]